MTVGVKKDIVKKKQIGAFFYPKQVKIHGVKKVIAIVGNTKNLRKNQCMPSIHL